MTKIFRHRLRNGYLFATAPWLSYELPLDEITTLFACSFGPSGWHPLVETLRQYEANPKINYRDTALFSYHKNFQPKWTDEALVGYGQNLKVFNYPWGTFLLNQGLKDPASSRFCGPSTDSFVEEEFKRTTALYARIKVEGYSPWAFGHSFVGGTLLLHSDGRKRFVVSQGNHRTACLAALGEKTMKVRLYPSYLITKVKREEVDSWPEVLGGKISKELALKIFDAFFSNSGFHILTNF